MSSEDTHSQVMGIFCGQEPEQEPTLLGTDPPSPRSRSVTEMKGVGMKDVSTSNREISI